MKWVLKKGDDIESCLWGVRVSGRPLLQGSGCFVCLEEYYYKSLGKGKSSVAMVIANLRKL
jgi:hypothetical protein